MHKPISKGEWFAILVFALIVDIAQILLNIFFGSGIAVNRIISLIMTFVLNGYLWWRGVSLVTAKQLANSLATATGEMIPIADTIPIWTISVILSWLTVKADSDPNSFAGKAGKAVKLVNVFGKKAGASKIANSAEGAANVARTANVATGAGTASMVGAGASGINNGNLRPPPLNSGGIRRPQSPRP